MEYKIGDFAVITRHSIKVLRRYHEEGLLVPTRVEEGTGYRYYDESLIDRARTITVLRGWKFTLKEIASILEEAADDEDLVDIMQRKKDQIKADISRLKTVEKDLSKYLATERKARAVKEQLECRLKDIPPVLVASITYSGEFDECGTFIGQLYKAAGSRAAGPCFNRYSIEEGREKEDIEVCLPVRSKLAKTRVECRTIEAAKVVSVMFRGPYSEMGRAYRLLVDYRKKEGLTLAGPWREIYHKGPGMIFTGNPRKYLTEVQMPIA